MGGGESVEKKEVEKEISEEKVDQTGKYDHINIDYESSKSLQFPTDCIGIIIEFISSSKDILNFEITCKVVHHYITVEYPGCCRHVNFRMFIKPTKPQLKCHKLTINRNDFKCKTNKEEISDDDFRTTNYFPNLRHLTLNGVKLMNLTDCRISSSCFQYLSPNLTHLDIENIPTLKDEDFKHLPNLRKLSIRYEVQSIIPQYMIRRINETPNHPDKEKYQKRSCPNGSFLKYVPKLETLKLSDLHDSLKNEYFQTHPPKKLRKLVLWNIRGLAITFLKHLKHLEHLEIFDSSVLENVWSDRVARENALKNEIFGVKNTSKNLVFLSIRDCLGFGHEDNSFSSSEEFLRNECLPKKKKGFELIYKPKRLLPGGLRPLKMYC